FSRGRDGDCFPPPRTDPYGRTLAHTAPRRLNDDGRPPAVPAIHPCDTIFPEQCPDREGRSLVLLGRRPSLHALRRSYGSFVRALRGYYGTETAVVSTPADSSMNPRRFCRFRSFACRTSQPKSI